ncbi:unnamed protein product [Linum trigynum]|uniref:Homeobox-leucine zipper protein n=1 Tax=Linum trigynum TaxID=586398 RepID=A0AAV2DHY8_9ROSI
MDWNGNLRNLNVPRPSEASFNFLYSYNYDQFPPVDVKQLAEPHHQGMNVNYGGGSSSSNSNNYASHQQQQMMTMMMMEKKKRLSNEQLESLERSFQEEIKLDPDRKMKLSRELGLQPRQIAVWFQNRRARWKAKQLERLYDSLKHEFDSVSKEKLKLQEEVMKLRGMLREQATRNKQVSTAGYTEVISGEETVESTSGAVGQSSSGRAIAGGQHQMTAESNYLMSVDEYNPVVVPSPAYWATTLPSYH